MAGIKGQKSGGSINAGRKKLSDDEKRSKTFTTKTNQREYDLLLELLSTKKVKLKKKTNIETILIALEKL